MVGWFCLLGSASMHDWHAQNQYCTILMSNIKGAFGTGKYLGKLWKPCLSGHSKFITILHTLIYMCHSSHFSSSIKANNAQWCTKTSKLVDHEFSQPENPARKPIPPPKGYFSLDYDSYMWPESHSKDGYLLSNLREIRASVAANSIKTCGGCHNGPRGKEGLRVSPTNSKYTMFGRDGGLLV